MRYDWITCLPDGQLDAIIAFDGERLHALLDLLRAHGVLDEETPPPPFPPEGASPFAWDAVLAAESPHPLRIPSYKLIDQSGWKLTAAECYLLAHRLRWVRDGDVAALVAFAAQAVAKGGLRVC